MRTDGRFALAGGRGTSYDSVAGISGDTTIIMCDVLSVADTSREDVPRQEVSAP